MRRNQFASEIVGSLADYEQQIDRTIASGSKLLAQLVEGRIEVKYAAAVGQEALEQLASSLVGLVRSRQSVVDGHTRLEETRAQLGLREVATGDKVTNPKFIPMGVEAGLRVVAG